MLKQKTSSYQAVIILSQNDYLDVAMPGTSPAPPAPSQRSSGAVAASSASQAAVDSAAAAAD
jgi:hypothetical protein